MKSFIIGLLAFTTFQWADAANGTLFKCSVNKRPQTVSGFNLFLDGGKISSGKVFFRTSPGVELGRSTYTEETKVEQWYYGSDINRPANKETVSIVSSSFFGERYSAKVEIRVSLNSTTAIGTLTVLDDVTYIAKNVSMTCDLTRGY